jgi:4,5-DOPA dioxygenase extradiol
MTVKQLSSVFVSHGAPTIAVDDLPVTVFLRGLGESLGRPSAVLCVSAHWETAAPAVLGAARPSTIHDFYGFPEPLYRLQYPAPGAPDLARRVAEVLAERHIACAVEPERGLDHGAWVPLMFMYPEADVPVTQLSIQPDAGPVAHLALGRALVPLRKDGVLVLASGGAVHNLRYFRAGSAEVPDWAGRFDDWLAAAVEAGDGDALVHYRDRAADGAMAHPRDEHYLPLLVAFGAGDGARGRILHRGFMDGALSAAAFAFG